MRVAGAVSVVLRVIAAALLACAGVVVGGLPAAAEVTEWTIQSPAAGEPIAAAVPLIVDVQRAASPPEEKVAVRTRVLDGTGQPLAEELVELQLTGREEGEAPGADRLRYSGMVDPYAFAWLDGAPAPNGSYTLQVHVQVQNGDVARDPSPWRDHPILLDALPQPPESVAVKVRSVDKQRLVVRWSPSPTPDLSHYILERRVDGGPWTLAQDNLDPTAAKVVDPVSGYGDYRYRVLAARWSGDGNGELRTAESAPSSTVELEQPAGPAPTEQVPPTDEPADAAASAAGAGNDGSAAPAGPADGAQPRARVPADANQTYKGPLDYGVQPTEVTERVPVKVAKSGGGTQEGGVLEVVERSVDQQRILPAVAGGLILVLSAAHVVRFLNE